MAANVALYDNRDYLEALTSWFKESKNQGSIGGTMVKLAEVYANFSGEELPDWTAGFRTASNCCMPAKMVYQSLNLVRSAHDYYNGKKGFTSVVYQFSIDFVGDFCRFVPIFTKAYPVLISVRKLTSFVKDVNSTYDASKKAGSSQEGLVQEYKEMVSRLVSPDVDTESQLGRFKTQLENQVNVMAVEQKRSYLLDLAKNIVSLAASVFALLAVVGYAYLTATQTLYLSLASASLGLISSFYESMMTIELASSQAGRIQHQHGN